MLDPHGLLAKVHPDLVAVIKKASQTPQPFQVVYGIRTLEAEKEALAKGNSKTLNSRHLADPHFNGEAMAVDIACLDKNGKISWTVADANGGTYGVAAKQILVAAHQLNIPVQWGGSPVGAWIDGVVSHFRDWGHFQLDRSTYA